MDQIMALHRRERGGSRILFFGRPDKEIDNVFIAMKNQRGHAAAVEVIEPAADKRKFPRGQILDRRREIQLSLKPGLHGVLIGGADVEQMRAHQGSHVTGDDILRHFRRGGGRLPCPDRASHGAAAE